MLEFASGKKYIGITRQTPDARYTTHKAGIKTRKQLIHKAWAKHGDPTMTVLAELPDEELAQAEIDAIQKHKTLNPDVIQQITWWFFTKHRADSGYVSTDA